MFDIFLEDSSQQKWEHVFMSENNFFKYACCALLQIPFEWNNKN